MPKKPERDERKRVVVRFGPFDPRPGVRVLMNAWGPTRKAAERELARMQALSLSLMLEGLSHITGNKKRRQSRLKNPAKAAERAKALDRLEELRATKKDRKKSWYYKEVAGELGRSWWTIREWYLAAERRE